MYPDMYSVQELPAALAATRRRGRRTAAVLAYHSLARITGSRWDALTATLLAFASYYALYYADMIFNEVTIDLFAVMLTFHGMVIFVQEGCFRQLLVKSGMALLFGIAILAFNFGNEYFALGGEVPLRELPSLRSAVKRLGGSEAINALVADSLQPGSFWQQQFYRIGSLTLPYAVNPYAAQIQPGDPEFIGYPVIGLGALALGVSLAGMAGMAGRARVRLAPGLAAAAVVVFAASVSEMAGVGRGAVHHRAAAAGV